MTGPSSAMRYAQSLSNVLMRAFPTPELLYPRAAGIDISDASIKWVVLEGVERGELQLESWGEVELTSGIVVAGLVNDVEGLSHALSEMHRQIPHVNAAHVALPEEAAFIFNMNVPRTADRTQVLNMIEFELDARVPIPPSQAVYDFNEIPGSEGADAEVGVVVFPRELAESYAAAFDASGMTLLSLELEARSIARAVSPDNDEVALLVDFGGTRTGFAVMKHGIPLFSSTVEIGGDALSAAVAEKAGIPKAEVTKWKNEVGLVPAEGAKDKAALEAISGIASSLGDEIAKHYRYWDTRRDEHGARVTPLSRVFLVGGSANLHGLPEYIAARVQAPVERPNVWRNVARFDDYVPPIDQHTSLQYATAIGLALRSF